MDKKNIEDILALTPMQEGMLFHYLKEPESTQYSVQLSVRLSGTLNVQRMEQAWNLVVKKHEMLRTTYRWKKLKRPVQLIWKSNSITVTFKDFFSKDISESLTLLDALKEEERNRIFNLQEVPLRVTLCKLTNNVYEMIVGIHHIQYDGWSNGIILKDLISAYYALIKSKNAVLPPSTPLKNYIQWLKNSDKSEGKKFWRDYLVGYSRLTTLPKTTNTPEGQYLREEYIFDFSKDLSEEVKALAKEQQISVNFFFKAAWGILLHHYNNTDDVVFGDVVSGRPPGIKGIDDMVGLFINTIPLRVQIKNSNSVLALVKMIQEKSIQARAYEYVPLAEIQAQTELKENLLDHLISFQNYPLDQLLYKKDEIGFSIDNTVSNEHTNYDYNLVIFPGEKISAKVIFNSLSYTPGIIRTIIQHYNEVMKQIVSEPHISVEKIQMINRTEEKIDNDTPGAKKGNRRDSLNGKAKGFTREEAEEKSITADFDF
jgi:hypothetical protein